MYQGIWEDSLASDTAIARRRRRQVDGVAAYGALLTDQLLALVSTSGQAFEIDRFATYHHLPKPPSYCFEDDARYVLLPLQLALAASSRCRTEVGRVPSQIVDSGSASGLPPQLVRLGHPQPHPVVQRPLPQRRLRQRLPLPWEGPLPRCGESPPTHRVQRPGRVPPSLLPRKVHHGTLPHWASPSSVVDAATYDIGRLREILEERAPASAPRSARLDRGSLVRAATEGRTASKAVPLHAIHHQPLRIAVRALDKP